jgi:hypothetical protein
VSLESDDWPVCIKNNHAGYIDWETYLKNQDKLRSNLSRPFGSTPGAPNSGPALLAGLVLCGQCGRRMRTSYPGGSKRRWSYICYGKKTTGQNICWSVPGNRVDDAVNDLFLQTVVPSEIDLSLAVEREADDQARSLEQQWRARIEQAGYAARLAERRYKAVDPDNRVVARTLEREWEDRLQDLDEVERQYSDAKRARRVELSQADRDQIRLLARNLPTIWKAPTTQPAERKAMLRLVIEAITLSPVDIPRRTTRVQVQWHSGVVTQLQVDRPHRHQPQTAAIDRLRTLALEGYDDDTIAAMLNAEGHLAGRDTPWTRKKVGKARRQHDIPRIAPRQRKTWLPDRHPETGHYSVPGAARRFGVSKGVIRHWIDRGLVPTYTERYGPYDARWLIIDHECVDKLTELAAKSRKRRT